MNNEIRLLDIVILIIIIPYMTVKSLNLLLILFGIFLAIDIFKICYRIGVYFRDKKNKKEGL